MVTLSKSASVWWLGSTRYVIDPEQRITVREGSDMTPRVVAYPDAHEFNTVARYIMRLGTLV